ncbi:DoxX family protein [Leucobacter luti]|uniref:DoxX-like protein n=1 Tax=Leucobacter luti TaxID=340320 RepID=A0A4Q7TIS9_9MICO|nr:DoxX family protein [Leucobacter luti]MBL3700385.1 DoxX family protein [Leucobacter luti]RZT60556.1 DoxX-like protein [Leucobacter luti]
MSIAVWIVSGLLALAYLAAGGMKLVRSKAELRPTMAWVEGFSPAAIKVIAALEVLGGIGLILPPLTGVAPWLAVVAAFGLVAVQIGAIAVHIRYRDPAAKLVPNFVLLLLALFVAVGLLL